MSPQIATETKLSRAEVLEFLRPRHGGILATTRRDGRPQLSPVTLGVSSSDRIVISTYPERAKARNLRRNPAVSLCVMSDDGDPWIQVDGTGRVLDLPDAMEGLVDYYRCISGEHPDWDEYRAAMERQGKCLLEIDIESWGPQAQGGFPARLVTTD